MPQADSVSRTAPHLASRVPREYQSDSPWDLVALAAGSGWPGSSSHRSGSATSITLTLGEEGVLRGQVVEPGGRPVAAQEGQGLWGRCARPFYRVPPGHGRRAQPERLVTPARRDHRRRRSVHGPRLAPREARHPPRLQPWAPKVDGPAPRRRTGRDRRSAPCPSPSEI